MLSGVILSVIMLNSVIINVAIKPCMLNGAIKPVMLSVVIQSVVVLNVLAPSKDAAIS